MKCVLNKAGIWLIFFDNYPWSYVVCEKLNKLKHWHICHFFKPAFLTNIRTKFKVKRFNARNFFFFKVSLRHWVRKSIEKAQIVILSTKKDILLSKNLLYRYNWSHLSSKKMYKYFRFWLITSKWIKVNQSVFKRCANILSVFLCCFCFKN